MAEVSCAGSGSSGCMLASRSWTLRLVVSHAIRNRWSFTNTRPVPGTVVRNRAQSSRSALTGVGTNAASLARGEPLTAATAVSSVGMRAKKSTALGGERAGEPSSSRSASMFSCTTTKSAGAAGSAGSSHPQARSDARTWSARGSAGAPDGTTRTRRPRRLRWNRASGSEANGESGRCCLPSGTPESRSTDRGRPNSSERQHAFCARAKCCPPAGMTRACVGSSGRRAMLMPNSSSTPCRSAAGPSQVGHVPSSGAAAASNRASRRASPGSRSTVESCAAACTSREKTCTNMTCTATAYVADGSHSSDGCTPPSYLNERALAPGPPPTAPTALPR